MAAPSYLLDTNILSSAIKQPSGPVAKHIARVGVSAQCTSVVVACELRYGAMKKQAPTLSRKVSQLLEQIEVLPLPTQVGKHYAQLRCHLERIGQPIGANDLLIAAHALALDLTLVTANVKEFSRVPDLKVENWLTQSA